MTSLVKDVMTSAVVAVGESAPFKEIVEAMSRNGVSALPVIDGHGALVGIVSEADLILKEARNPSQDRDHWLESRRRRAERHKAAGAVARDVMTAEVVTIGPADTVREAARRMHEHGVKRLPVIEAGGRVVGIVSRADLLKVFLRSDREIREEIEKDVLVRTLWMEPGAVRVFVGGGVVTLRGRVERRSLIEVIERLVHEVDGVVDVGSEISFEVDDTDIHLSENPPGVLPSSVRWP